MNKTYLLIVGLMVILIGLSYIHTSRSHSQKIYTAQEADIILHDLYSTVNGFTIEAPERAFIESQGGDPTYGEITTESVATLIGELALHHKDHFFDLGSGVGKVCTQVALTTPAYAIGIELSATRHQHAQEIKQELIKRKILINPDKLRFIEQNILDANLSEATVIFLCSTCFSDMLMEKLTAKMAHECNRGLRVITLKDLPLNTYFSLIKRYELPMSWSQASPVYLYQLTNC